MALKVERFLFFAWFCQIIYAMSLYHARSFRTEIINLREWLNSDYFFSKVLSTKEC